MITFAKKKNIQIMLGCMAESSCATTAMAHLMASADFIDLDAPELYTNDPFRGLSYENGLVNLNDKVGLGLEPTSALLDLF
jgi:L-alanine-DL-glutamate epimerase-like enolase superfamily enzyme